MQEIAWLEHFEESKGKQFCGLKWIRKINENGRLLCIELKMKVGRQTFSHARAQSCLILCDPIDYSLPGPSVHGIFESRILELVAISFSRASSDPGIKPKSPALAGGFFYQ